MISGRASINAGKARSSPCRKDASARPSVPPHQHTSENPTTSRSQAREASSALFRRLGCRALSRCFLPLISGGPEPLHETRNS